ncbi:4-hydroxythreonine-4-phosphate dehydrogenase [Halomicrobium zhouii]|uniref:4-hydroxythreonine-4-phosphate dehydrogenase n=1 Tax=Halomicrobium zhouii TaxID=767519 RepID=A0A1I6KET1_9EURY|nr:4-hydroxythreonine-4-phosphate dehydrogenase PdxA [Halomicrobium zhouii]SFR89749.1 4-hydroxythreonine-4-phosphate dehydrogenase [Halomicrobium zhouii]
MSEHKPVVAVTMGDPAGVGSEVIVKGHARASRDAIPVVVGDADVLRDAVEVSGSPLSIRTVDDPADARDDQEIIDVIDLDNVSDLSYGDLREAYGAASLEYVERAIELATSGAVDAITTAPINKQATRMAGSEYAGHTGMLADYTDTDHYSMLLVEDDLRVSHVSTHVPLSEACDLVTEERVFQTVRVTDDALRSLDVDAPTVAVAGLNPHASDGGLLGDAEAEEIEPAIERAQNEGIDVVGPESPDTVFSQAAAGDDVDCVVAMYHDQGHIPIKMLGFESGGVSGVNVTIGLPIVRTSVDHGTAFDIAGEGIASEESLVDAVELAARMARN